MPPKVKKEKKEAGLLKEKEASSAAAARRRNRVPISCTICRRRKVKCDKKRPVCTACERTGVAHLCHYIDPPWAQPLSDAELNAGGVAVTESTTGQVEQIEKLKEKIKALEAQLNQVNNISSPGSSINDSDSATHYSGATTDEDPNESLNLGKKFDMLHIKTTTTVHLGATSWLAIMKGDPYLRVLWAHIFKLRKQAEEIKFRKSLALRQTNQPAFPATPSVSGQPAKQSASPAGADPNGMIPTCPVSGKDLSQGKCPVLHTSGKCPVTDKPSQSPSPSPSPGMVQQQKTPSPLTECPVSGKTSSTGKCPVAHLLDEPVEEDEALNDQEPKKRKSAPDSTNSKKAKYDAIVEDEEENDVKEADREEADVDQDEQDGEGVTIQANTSRTAPQNERDERVCPLMMGDNSFLEEGEFNELPAGHPPTNRADANEKSAQSPENKRAKRRTKSNDNQKEDPEKKAKPEDFKKDPVGMMQKFLPTKKVFWMLLDRFFEILYIYMPFVDEESFKKEVQFIFGDRDDKDQAITIKIRSGVDFALVGTTCIILRLTWNTLPMNNLNKALKKSSSTVKTYPENPQIMKILQKPENEIPIELVDCVKHCFSNLKLMRRSSLKIVQCALYMRLYFLYSPEEGDGADGSDSQIFLGMIVQMAISIGLHRDPKNFENFTNERQRHLWRKIWYELLSLDIQQSMNLGCPRCLQNVEEFSDTNLPGETVDGLDLKEFENDIRELTVIKNTHTKYNIDKLLSNTMKILLNVNEPATRHQLDQLIESLQKSINGFGIQKDRYSLSQLGKILINRTKSETLASSATRALEFKLHVTVNMLIYLLNYILFVHFEPKGGSDPQSAHLAKNYAQRALDCALEGYRNCTLFFDCGLEYFGPGVDLILAPLMLLIGHRSIQFMVSLILRSRCGPFMKPSLVQPKNGKETIGSSIVDPKSLNGSMNVENGYNNIDNTNHDLKNVEIKDRQAEYSSIFNVDVNSGEILATILLQHMDKFHNLAAMLGDKYQYSWKMSKAVGFFVTLLKKPINVVKTVVKTENVRNVENSTGNVSSILDSVPLVLSAEEEDARRKSLLKEDSNKQAISEGSTPLDTRSPCNYDTLQQHQQQHQQQQQQLLLLQQQQQQQHEQNVLLQQQQYQQHQQQNSYGINSSYPEMNPDENSFMYGSYAQFNQSIQASQSGVPKGLFSLAFNNHLSDLSNNPINSIDVDINEQFPEIIQATEGFGDNNRSFGEFFGVSAAGAVSPLSNPVVGAAMGTGNMYGDPNTSGAAFMGGNEGGFAGNFSGPNGTANTGDVNMMMSGNWFS